MKSNFEIQLFELNNFVVIQKACEVSMSDSKFFAIAGETGTGKTVALKHFANKNKDFIKYIRLRESMNTSDFFKEVAYSFGYRLDYKSLYRFMNWIRDYIESSDEKHLLIIDEGGKFKASQYGFIHELRDLTEGKMGIVLAGPKYFLDTLRYWNEKKIKGIPEFYRRVNLIIPLHQLQKDEIYAVCKAYGINSTEEVKKNFESIKSIGDLTDAIQNYLIYNSLIGNTI